MASYFAVEGLPAAGKSELLSTLALYHPGEILVLPELVRVAVDERKLDLFSDRGRLADALLEMIGLRQERIRAALGQGRTVIEDSHLGVHAAYARVLGDQAFLERFAEIEDGLLWPSQFVRMEIPVHVSLARQAVRGTPNYEVGPDVMTGMLSALAAWHMGRRSDLISVDADRAAHEVLATVSELFGLHYGTPVGDVLPAVLLLGRPASGKSELIQFLQALSADERAKEFHLGPLDTIDDFPILWEKFVEDDLWEAVGRGRLVSRRVGENYSVADDSVWPFLIAKLNRKLAARGLIEGRTALVEFARGGPQAYRRALEDLAPEVLAQAAVLYVEVPFAESSRRNRARYDRARRAGLLTHAVPEEELERSYSVDDWSEFAPGTSGVLQVARNRLPYVTVHNMPEPAGPDAFRARYAPAFQSLYRSWKALRRRQGDEATLP